MEFANNYELQFFKLTTLCRHIHLRNGSVSLVLYFQRFVDFYVYISNTIKMTMIVIIVRGPSTKVSY